MDYKLKTRKEASANLHHGIAEIIYGAIEKSKNYPFATCLTCISYVEKDNYCRKHEAYPPPRVIVYSCDDYFDTDDIPF